MPCDLFTPFRQCDGEMRNRIVVSPMCQYSGTDALKADPPSDGLMQRMNYPAR